MLHESTKSGRERHLSEQDAPQVGGGTSGGSQENREPSSGSRPATQALLRRCALCGKRYQMTQPKLAPFCSERCQQVDLGNWLGEAYGLPWEDPAGGEDLGSFEDA